MPTVRQIQAASVHGRTQRAQAASDAALDQGGDGEGEDHREADVAGVEERRVEGERGVLQQRVEAAAFDLRRDAQEGIGGEDDEQQEGDGDAGLHGQHVGA